MPRVEFPNGDAIDFPDDLPQSEIDRLSSEHWQGVSGAGARETNVLATSQAPDPEAVGLPQPRMLPRDQSRIDAAAFALPLGGVVPRMAGEVGPMTQKRRSLEAQGVDVSDGAPAEVQRQMSTSLRPYAVSTAKIALENYFGGPVEVVEDPATGVVLYRDPQTGVRKPVDVPGFTNLSQFQADLGGIVPDIFEGAVAYTMELGGFALGSIAGPSGAVAGGVVLGGVGAGMGAYMRLKEGQRYGQNLELGDEELIATAVREQGLTGAAAALVSAVLGRMILGKGMLPRDMQFTPIADEAAAAAERLGLPPITIGQASESPFVQKLYGYSLQFSKEGQATVEIQKRALLERLRAEEKATGDVSMTNLMHYVDAQEKSIANQVANFRNIPREEGFHAIHQGVREHTEWLEKAADKKFGELRVHPDAASAVYDVSPLVERFKELRRGVPSQSLPDPDTGQINEIALGSSGLLHPDMARIAGQLEKLDPLLAAQNDASLGQILALDKLRALRRDLFDLRDHDDPSVRRLSSELWQMTKKIMATPQNASEEYASLVQHANKFYASIESFKNLDFISQALRKGALPEEVMGRYMEPGNVDEALTALKLIVPRERWRTFQDAFSHDLLSRGKENPQATLDRLNAYATHQTALRALMDEPTEQAIRKWATDYKEFLASPAKKSVDEWISHGSMYIKQAQAERQAFRKAVQGTGGMDGPIASKARMALYKEILDAVETDSRNFVETVANPTRLSALIRQYRRKAEERGYNFFMRSKDWSALNDARNYALGVNRTPREGTQIAGAGQIGQTFKPQSGFGALVWLHYRANAATAAVLSMPYTRGQVLLPYTDIKRQLMAWGTALGTLADGHSPNSTSP